MLNTTCAMMMECSPSENFSSVKNESSAMASTGTASKKMKLVAYKVHTNTGRRIQVMPGARSQ